MKRVHLLEPSTALIELNGTPVIACDSTIECDQADCGYDDHYVLIAESELEQIISAGVHSALNRLGLSGRAVS